MCLLDLVLLSPQLAPEDLLDLLLPLDLLGLAHLSLLCHPLGLLDLVVPAHQWLQLDLLVPEDLLGLSLPEDQLVLLARFLEDLVGLLVLDNQPH